MRNCYRKLVQDGKNILEAENMLGSDGAKATDENGLKRGNTRDNDGVGEMQDQGEFGLGVAPRDSRPVNKIELTKEKEAEIAEAQAYVPYSEEVIEADLDDEQVLLEAARHKNKPKKRKAVDKQTAFLEFKQESEGRMLEDSIRDNRVELKTIKTAVKELTEECNVAKRNIDTVKVELDKKQDERKQSM